MKRTTAAPKCLTAEFKFSADVDLADPAWKPFGGGDPPRAFVRPLGTDWVKGVGVEAVLILAGIDWYSVRPVPAACLALHTEGCAFDGRDTKPQCEDHLGTLMFVSNSKDLEGGRWSLADPLDSEFEPTGKPGGQFIVFLPVNTPLTLSPITKGHQLVAKAPIFGKLKPAEPDSPPKKPSKAPFRRKPRPGFTD